ncbi:MAG TPA: NAD(P)H-hydrate epimerase [Pirellulaceae bacterium]|nr:NAD(P)H-hydrate epimerase [Pirellulaceae bacterium]
MRHLTCEQARSVDRRAVEEFGVSSLVLMENAGRGCADLLCRLGIRGRVVICCGRGNNAGDGFVIARHLELRGKEVRVLLWSDPHKLSADAAANFAILEKSSVPIHVFTDSHEPGVLPDELVGADWIVDALLGTGAQGEPRPPLDSVIDLINLCDARKLAIDLPSGLLGDSGQASSSTFRADHTATFVAPKIGFAASEARAYLGLIHVLDIGAPRVLVEQVVSQGQLLS